MYSLIDMVSESVACAGIVVVPWVIDVFSVGVGVRVTSRGEVRIVREEKTVPGAVLLVLSVLLVTEGLIVSLKHRFLGDIEFFFGDHSREGFKVRASEPWVLHHVGVN